MSFKYILGQGGRMVKISNDTKIFEIIFKKKIITIDALSSLLNSSTKTARRRLKRWEAYTSYNENGRYYTLPNIPQFDENGLWAYRKVHFSKHGNLKQAIINLIKRSKAGLDAAEISDLLGISVRSFLTALQKHPDLKREKVQGRYVYFSAVEKDYINQKDCRAGMSRIKQLPSDFEAILILVETIKNPQLSIEDLSAKLRDKNCNVTPESIRNLFDYHGLTVKKML
jgi:predicted transcriptional regulator